MESQYCRAGNVVANLRCRVQLQMESTRQGLPLTRKVASGTHPSGWALGQGGRSAEQKQASKRVQPYQEEQHGGLKDERAALSLVRGGQTIVFNRAKSSQLYPGLDAR